MTESKEQSNSPSIPPADPVTNRPKVLIDEEKLQKRVSELAAEITRDYQHSENVICLGVLKGSVFFMVDLLKQIDLPFVVDFFQVSSYGSGTVPGEVRIRKDADMSVRDRDVLLIEDIVDTGHTLHYLHNMLSSRGAASWCRRGRAALFDLTTCRKTGAELRSL